jgi:hypothetical protein
MWYNEKDLSAAAVCSGGSRTGGMYVIKREVKG